jgi:LacI family transcriptional regulator
MKAQNTTPTLHDVAAFAGVSTATVSRCLNFPDRVAEKTRTKVQAAVDSLGYSPNFGAQVMASRRTKTIGAIIPTMENAVFARGLQAFQEELDAHGYTLLVASSSYRRDLEEKQIRSLVSRGADALLLIGHDRDPEVYDFLQTRGVPSLVAWAYDPDKPHPAVGFDNHAAMKQMAQHVIELGHRQLALITADTTANDRARERFRGIQSAMDEAGLAASDLHIIETEYSIENGAAAFETLAHAVPRPTVVFCGNDVLAVGALRRARELQIAVPDDISVIGFDDIELAQIAYPALTTVAVPHREMGIRAARELMNMLEGKMPKAAIELSARMKLRDTLATLSPN